MVYFKRIVNLALAFILLLWWQNGNVLADMYSRSLPNFFQESTSKYRETTLFELGIHHHMLGKYLKVIEHIMEYNSDAIFSIGTRTIK